MSDLRHIRETLRRGIEENAFVTKDERELFGPSGKEFNWFLDIKGVLFKRGTLSNVSELFWDHLKGAGPFQIGGLETVAIALMSGVVMRAERDGVSLNSFYVRKSRKRDGMQRDVEGMLTDEPVILIDDALNSGKSIVRQVEALKAKGKKVVEVCVIVAFRDPSFYTYFTEHGIRVWSIFTLDDLPKTGGLRTLSQVEPSPPRMPFHVDWKFETPGSRYELVVPKSAPVVDGERVYFGTDNGSMWALDQKTGSVVWRFETLRGAGRKRIFSSPALHDSTVFFGSYDGNFYALDATTGKKKWVYFEADWIGSSPCVAPDLGLVYIGLEFGLWKKHGALVALDANTGEKKWLYQVETHVHSSPAYSKKLGLVAVGSLSGEVFCIDALTGELRWSYTESGDVKGGLVFDEKRGLVIFGSWDDRIHMVDVKTGKAVRSMHTFKPIYSNPVIWEDRLYMGLLDKRIVCVDLDTAELVWQYQTHSRVFATPAIIGDTLYCGSNDGRLYLLDARTGNERSYFQVNERIVNKIAYNQATGRIFLPTYAGEMYGLSPIGTLSA